VYQVRRDGTIEHWIDIAESSLLNGFTPYANGHAFTVDSFSGSIFDVSLDSPGYSLWLQHDLLTIGSAQSLMPGANGIKVYPNAVYVTNTDRARVLRIAIEPDGSPGAPQTIAERLRGDDFAFDRDGAIYITTHVHNSLVRLLPNGDRATFAAAGEGLAGSTACAFGTAPGDDRNLYVTTTGGIVAPLDGVVQEAKLVRLEVGVSGYPVAFA
jgi:sugar lactone lactonase YvrE